MRYLGFQEKTKYFHDILPEAVVDKFPEYEVSPDLFYLQ